MPLISFSKFPDKIKSGEKRQTIRSPRKPGYEIKKGDRLVMYWKVRTKEKYKIGESICTEITPIVIGEDFVQTPNTKITVPEFLEKFAKLDGFDSWAEMVEFFRPKLGQPLEVIQWQYPLID